MLHGGGGGSIDETPEDKNNIANFFGLINRSRFDRLGSSGVNGRCYDSLLREVLR